MAVLIVDFDSDLVFLSLPDGVVLEMLSSGAICAVT